MEQSAPISLENLRKVIKGESPSSPVTLDVTQTLLVELTREIRSLNSKLGFIVAIIIIGILLSLLNGLLRF